MNPPAGLPFPAIDPVIFSIGPVAVHWYGLGYVVGILFGWWVARRLTATDRLWAGGKSPIPPLAFDDFLAWAALGIVLGGRLGFILFYDLQKYLADPTDMLAIWRGGMSFHGGFLGVLVALVLFSRRHGLPLRSMFDVLAVAAPVGIGVVRCANFINSELWGRVTDVPWAFVFPNGGPLPRHPSQLYEAALEGFLMFAILCALVYKGRMLTRPGFVAGAFVALYGCARIFVEFFRVPDEQLGYLAGGWLTMGMVLSIPLALVGLWFMATARPAPK